jgi:signal transduction histidine kinase
MTKGQSAILVSLNESVAKLNRLNKNLLLLSKIEKNQFHETQKLSIKEIIEKQLEFFKVQAKQKNITLKTHFQSDCFVHANIGLTEILISNLLLNAIRHNVKNGDLNILVSDSCLEVINTGINEELLTDKLFNRFSKANNSNHGNGLGLAIVKKIASLNKWNVSYKFLNKTHVFSVRF